MSAILAVRDLHCAFDTPRGVLKAVNGVSFEVAQAETLGLVGESGCGKSTLARSIVGLVRPKSGSIEVQGVETVGLSRRRRNPLRRTVQYIFQDPYTSLNPRLSAGALIGEPLAVQGIGSRVERAERVAWLMDRVGLRADWAGRLPHEFSGGQRQRIGIARALALQPALIICDEPVSALDVSIQAQVINLLAELQREFGVAYLFISHDLALVEHVAARIAVMYLGHLVEIADRASLWSDPLHPYTRALIDAVPVPDPALARVPRALLEGDVPSPIGDRSGCCFAGRCPHAQEICRTIAPPLRMVAAGRQAACHFVQSDAGGVIETPNRPSLAPHDRVLA